MVVIHVKCYQAVLPKIIVLLVTADIFQKVLIVLLSLVQTQNPALVAVIVEYNLQELQQINVRHAILIISFLEQVVQKKDVSPEVQQHMEDASHQQLLEVVAAHDVTCFHPEDGVFQDQSLNGDGAMVVDAQLKIILHQ